MGSVTGFSPWAFNGASHEWHLRLPRSAVFYLTIINKSVAARATESIGTGSLQLLLSHNLIALSAGINTKREKTPDTISAA